LLSAQTKYDHSVKELNDFKKCVGNNNYHRILMADICQHQGYNGMFPNINYMFWFPLENGEYHKVLANRDTYYQEVLYFLQKKKSYKGPFGQDIFLSEELDIIEYMTGLRIDE
jgi:hypothetical protein